MATGGVVYGFVWEMCRAMLLLLDLSAVAVHGELIAVVRRGKLLKFLAYLHDELELKETIFFKICCHWRCPKKNMIGTWNVKYNEWLRNSKLTTSLIHRTKLLSCFFVSRSVFVLGTYIEACNYASLSNFMTCLQDEAWSTFELFCFGKKCLSYYIKKIELFSECHR